MNNTEFDSQEIRNAFAEYDRQATITNFKVACTIGILLMPAGFILDKFVYPLKAGEFLKLRLLCSILIAIFLMALLTPFGRKNYRHFGIVLFMLPTSFMAWMIYATEGAASPYYAGLNLVLLVLALVLHWTFWESLIATFLVIALYASAVLAHSTIFHATAGIFVNNFYFLTLTGIIAITGSFFHSKTRFREFAFRYQLDQSKRELELSNTRLAEQNIALNQANREIKAAEMQLVQSEKMSSLGRFSAGLMHDILNPLNYSKTGLFTLHKKSRNLPPEMRAEFDPILTDIQDGVDRVQEIVQRLRNFTHPGEQAAEAIDLTAILNDARRFVSGGLKDKSISLELNIPPKQKVWIGRNDFSVVLINLLENSIDALEGKQFVPEEKPTIAVTSRSEGNRTVIAIRDNGPGIDPKIIAKIFDPFFTTKDVGKGTGLGLSICFGMIRGYGGTISVASEPGKFSEFTLNLPANQEAAAQTKLSHAEPIRL